VSPFPRARFSVVIPAYNEESTLAASLTSITKQDYAGDVEVIVVDNGSTDATADIARSFGVTVVSEPVRGVCQARQRGTELASGEIIVSTDADTTHSRNWLTRIDRRLTEHPELAAVAGPCRFVDGPWWSAYTCVLFGFVRLFHRISGRVCYVTATNLAFRREVWSGYDLTLTQGGDELGLLRSLRKQGPIGFDAGNIAWTSSRRLRRGLIYNAVVTLLYFYLFAYNINRLTGRTILGMAPIVREGTPNSGSGPRRLRLSMMVAVVALVVVAYWLTPIDVDKGLRR
jgi:glycosyltransferase involved in cell wall biosynthesis